MSGQDEQAQRVRGALEGLRGKYGGASLATLAYAWVMRHPSRPVPVTGTRRVEGLREAVAATSIRFDAEDWYAVWQASIGHEVP